MTKDAFIRYLGANGASVFPFDDDQELIEEMNSDYSHCECNAVFLWESGNAKRQFQQICWRCIDRRIVSSFA